MIESVELRNWKTHKDTKIGFQKGVNVLIGIMGSGKSSIMDSISFALFGTFPALLHKRVSLKGLVTSRPFQENAAEVKLEFTVGKDRYTVVRKVPGGGGSTVSRLEKNGEYLQTQTERVNEEVESLLKVDYDTFSRAVYSEQNMMDYFLELPKGDRKKQIDQMLGLDAFSRAEENATSLVNSIRALIKEDEEALAQMDIRAQKEQLQRLATEIRTLSDEQERMKASAEQKRSAVKRLEGAYADLKGLEEKRASISQEIAAAEGRMAALDAEAKKLEKGAHIDPKAITSLLDSKQADRKLIDEEVKRLRAAESDALKSLTAIETEARIGGAKAKELEKLKPAPGARGKDAVEKAILELESHLDALRGKRAQAAGNAEEAKKALAELEAHIGKCPVCDRELDERMRAELMGRKKSIMEELKRATESTEAEIKGAESKIKSEKAEHEKAHAAEKSANELVKVMEALGKANLEAKARRQVREAAKSALEAALARQEAAVKELDAISKQLDESSRLEEYRKETKRLSGSVAEKRAQIAGMKVSKQEVEMAHAALMAELKALAEADTAVASNDKYLRELNRQLDDKVKMVARTEEIAAGIETKRSRLASMNKFKAALVETEAALRSRLVDSINSMMQDVWVRIYPYGDYQGIRLLSGRDDYVLEVATGTYADGKLEWADINGVASGGERSMACLAMRIAMSMVIVPNLRWLILDEPTHNIDENGISKLVSVLGDTLPSVVEQVFIITHDTALKNIAGARIYQLERDKAKNEYTKFSEL